jgi:hypothetical protein
MTFVVFTAYGLFAAGVRHHRAPAIRSAIPHMISRVVDASSSPPEHQRRCIKHREQPQTSRPANDRHAAAQPIT